MQQIIFITKYYCELCKKEKIVHLYGSTDSSFTTHDEPELIEWARHYHWIDDHRICAICGQLVKSGDLELMINDGTATIHEDYTDEFKKVRQKDRFGNLLIIHQKCIDKSTKSI